MEYSQQERPAFYTKRLLLQVVTAAAAEQVLDYYLTNRDFQDPWFSQRYDSFFTLKMQERHLQSEYEDFQKGRALPFWLSLRDKPQKIIGKFVFSNIFYGNFCSAIASWQLDQDHLGAGYALEAGRAALKIAFKDYKLHRIEANIMARNQASINLAHNLGFEVCGYEPHYLEIDGIWQDHLHFVRLAGKPGPAKNRYLLKEDRYALRQLNFGDAPLLVKFFQQGSGGQESVHKGVQTDLDKLFWGNLELTALLQSLAFWQQQLLLDKLSFHQARVAYYGLFADNVLVGYFEFSSLSYEASSKYQLKLALSKEKVKPKRAGYFLQAAIDFTHQRLHLRQIYSAFSSSQKETTAMLESMGFRQLNSLHLVREIGGLKYE